MYTHTATQDRNPCFPLKSEHEWNPCFPLKLTRLTHFQRNTKQGQQNPVTLLHQHSDLCLFGSQTVDLPPLRPPLAKFQRTSQPPPLISDFFGSNK